MLSILYIEDNPYNYRLIEKILTHAGYTIKNAGDGETGLAMVIAEQPSLILMDIDLPEMDGLEVTRRIRAHTNVDISSIPIIALTAQALWGDADRCYAAGCDGFIAKPVARKELLNAIHKFIPDNTPDINLYPI
jgi:two-component system, cell cycle response regulator DivK